MIHPPIHRFWSRWTLLFASLLAAAALTGCSISANSSAKTGGDAQAEGRSSGRSSASAKADARGSAKASGKSSSSSSGSASANANGKFSGKTGGSSKIVFKTKKRVSGMGKAKGGDHFKATALIGGGKSKIKINGKASGSASIKTGGSAKVKSSSSGSGKAGGSVKAGGSAKVGGKGKTEGKGKGSVRIDSKGASNSEKAASTEGKSKGSKKPSTSDDKTKPHKSKNDKTKDTDTKGGSKKTDDKDVEVPEVPVVIDPPDEAPDNDFGYETPVRGCFEGIVYPLAPQTNKLPTQWNPDDGISVVYACEWDIPTRQWSTGFPGVEERFEWFAIQYTGSFNIATAGTWKFRMSSDDGSKLFIDGKLVLDNDGEHPPEEVEVEVNLTAGDHDMVLEYFQGPRYHINLQLYATPPGGEEGIFSVR